MGEYATTFTLPVPLTSVVPAAALAAKAVNNGVKLQTLQTLVCKGSWIRLIGYPVTIRVDVWGTDGAAVVSVVGSSFGIGPIVNRTCRKDVEKFCGHLVRTLQQWGAQVPQAPVGAPPVAAG